MSTKLTVDLSRIAHFTNLAIPTLAILFFLAGYHISFYFHFVTVTFIFLTIINFFYTHVQTQHGILRNFGIIGQGRYLIESVGPQMRQYLFASDTEQRPFNREERNIFRPY